MPLKERQKLILDAVVRDYVRTARPVASQELMHEHDFGVGSATIRNEMLALDEQGFLEQPHPSAGRVPTDQGYRYFVDHLLTEEELAADEAATLRDAFVIRNAEEFLHEFTRRISQIAGAFAAAGMEDEHIFYKSGFSEVLEEPEFSDPERARGFGRLADVFDKKLLEMSSSSRDDRISSEKRKDDEGVYANIRRGGLTQSQPKSCHRSRRGTFSTVSKEVHRMLPGVAEAEQLWIGEENPWREARLFTIALASWEHPAGFRGFVSMVTPTRTNYPKHKAIIKCIREIV